jgi:hypothetical protein
VNFLQILFSTLVEKVKGAVEAVQDRMKYGSSGGGFSAASFSPQGIREGMNRHPVISASIVGVLVLSGVLYMLSDTLFTGGKIGGAQTRIARWYYTTDDGATFFPDDLNKISPYDKDGKKAVRAHVFSCDGGKTKFVGFLERQTAKAAPAVAAIPPSDAKQFPEAISDALRRFSEVKHAKAPEKEWSAWGTPASQKVIFVFCPDGKPATDEIYP